jgi:hypothetical protein
MRDCQTRNGADGIIDEGSEEINWRAITGTSMEFRLEPEFGSPKENARLKPELHALH